jgi:hypothetical protein
VLPDDFYGATTNHWLGVVEDRMDPIGMNRVRVRIFGIHPADNTMLNTGDLPWALVLMPNTTGGVSGLGATPHGLVEGSWVFGTFLDGDNAQQPLVLGTILGRARLADNDPCGLSNSQGNFSTDQLYQGGTVPAINVPGNENRERSYNFFIQNGYTPEQSAGIVGNLMAEATVKIDPNIQENGGNGPGYGIAQWTSPPRKRGLNAFARNNNYAVGTLETQLLYILHELNNEESPWNRKLKAASTPEQAAMAFCGYERPYIYKNGRCDPSTPEAQKRMGYARDTFEKYGKRTATPAASVENTSSNIANTSTSDVTGDIVPASTGGYNPCINPNIVDSTQTFQADVNPVNISTVNIASTNTARDIRVAGDEINSQANYLIRKDGSVERLNGPSSSLTIVLEGGSHSFAGSVTSQSDQGSTMYTLAQRNSLERLLKTLKAKNPALTVQPVGSIGFDPSMIGV